MVIVHGRRINNLYVDRTLSAANRHDQGVTIVLPSRKRERNPTTVKILSHTIIDFLPRSPEEANKELRTRAVSSYVRNDGISFRAIKGQARGNVAILTDCTVRTDCNTTRRRNFTVSLPEIFPVYWELPASWLTLAYFVATATASFPASSALSYLTNPTPRHADGINRIDVARIRSFLGALRHDIDNQTPLSSYCRDVIMIIYYARSNFALWNRKIRLERRI